MKKKTLLLTLGSIFALSTATGCSGTECQNPLIEMVSSMTLSEQVPAEYKVINSDGTLSKTIGNTTTADQVTATLTSISSWGNYQIDFEGLEYLLFFLIDSFHSWHSISHGSTTTLATFWPAT